jgi:hypothetical protein
LLSAPAQAILISGVTVSTDMGTSFGDINNTINGSGLSGNAPALTGDHARSSSTNSWGSSGTTTGTITFNFQSVYNLTNFSYWPYQGFSDPNLPPPPSSGISGVIIETSLDNANYIALQGSPTTLAPARESEQPTSVQQYTVSPTNAQYVRFSVTSSYGGSNTGLSEAQFSGTAVAVPWETDVFSVVGSTILFGLGVWAKSKSTKSLEK